MHLFSNEICCDRKNYRYSQFYHDCITRNHFVIFLLFFFFFFIKVKLIATFWMFPTWQIIFLSPLISQRTLGHKAIVYLLEEARNAEINELLAISKRKSLPIENIHIMSNRIYVCKQILSVQFYELKIYNLN